MTSKYDFLFFTSRSSILCFHLVLNTQICNFKTVLKSAAIRKMLLLPANWRINTLHIQENTRHTPAVNHQ